jgi:hypothetical protein
MAKPKSILQRVAVDVAKKAHDCQHNSKHRLVAGDKRLKVWRGRSHEHFCVNCALEIIERDMEKLVELTGLLRS